MSESLVRAVGLHKSYPSGAGVIRVLHGLDLEVAEGDSVAIVGDSGVGKSTLLHILGGLDRPDAGAVLFRGRAIHPLAPRARAEHRNRNVGFVFQFHHMLPELTALENVEMPFRIGRRLDAGRGQARDLLVRLGLGDRLTHYPGALSGGELQRVAIARALAVRPAVVLADEPTGNLDPRTGAEVFGLLRALQRERPFALLLATHSERLAGACDRVCRLENGILRALGEHESREYFRGLGARAPLDPMI
jgi:lipoprotein-releasing system ATP-binding protein